MFQKAVPVWAKQKEKEIHERVQFKGIIETYGEKDVSLKLATSGIYHVYVNGKFVAYGPARAGKGYFCVDELQLTQWVREGRNVIVIEVCGYYSTSFYVQKQPSFLMAELYMSGNPVLWTGEHFSARVNPEYIRKTQRYSYQRPMVEAYRILPEDTYLTDEIAGLEPLERAEAGIYLKRKAPYPQYEITPAEEISSGRVEKKVPETYYRDRSIVNIGQALSGFPIEELEVLVTDECQRMRFVPGAELCQGRLAADTYAVYSLPYNVTGMVKMSVDCEEAASLYVLFDEILSDGKVDFLRNDCADVVKYELPKGSHELQFFEVYTMKYIQVVVMGGACEIKWLGMVEYKHPAVQYDISGFEPRIREIADAAIETFRQNSVDLFTDCPSRERAGWLCDSFFTARAEHCLTGENVMERCFLENFLCEKAYDGIPEGMLPMCYPADHLSGEFIPNWALWLVIELEDFVTRTGDRAFAERFRDKVKRLLAYFEPFENEDGLLENLEGWIFVEWSKANELVQDVNYPTNMLYCKALSAAGSLYGRTDLSEKAEHLKTEILKQSFDGTFFTDNAVRKDGVLTTSGECTEVCQYYVFFFGIATKESHPGLYEILLNDFGPDRDVKRVYPEIYPANAFIGNYLRLDILMQYGAYERVYENIIGYFGYMAERTGTLWEYVGTNASCNHGFASYVICWLDRLKEEYERKGTI